MNPNVCFVHVLCAWRLYTVLSIMSQHFSDDEKCICFGNINFFLIDLSFVSWVELWKAVFGLLQSLAGHWRQQIVAALSLSTESLYSLVFQLCSCHWVLVPKHHTVNCDPLTHSTINKGRYNCQNKRVRLSVGFRDKLEKQTWLAFLVNWMWLMGRFSIQGYFDSLVVLHACCGSYTKQT